MPQAWVPDRFEVLRGQLVSGATPNPPAAGPADGALATQEPVPPGRLYRQTHGLPAGEWSGWSLIPPVVPSRRPPYPLPTGQGVSQGGEFCQFQGFGAAAGVHTTGGYHVGRE